MRGYCFVAEVTFNYKFRHKFGNWYLLTVIIRAIYLLDYSGAASQRSQTFKMEVFTKTARLKVVNYFGKKLHITGLTGFWKRLHYHYNRKHLLNELLPKHTYPQIIQLIETTRSTNKYFFEHTLKILMVSATLLSNKKFCWLKSVAYTRYFRQSYSDFGNTNSDVPNVNGNSLEDIGFRFIIETSQAHIKFHLM